MSLLFSVTSVLRLLPGLLWLWVGSLGSATESQPDWPGTSAPDTCPGCVFLVCSWEILGSQSQRLLQRDGHQAVSLRSCLDHLVWGHGMVASVLMLEGFAFSGGFEFKDWLLALIQSCPWVLYFHRRSSSVSSRQTWESPQPPVHGLQMSLGPSPFLRQCGP